MIVETSENRLFRVRDAGADLPHVWLGIPVKKVRGAYEPKAGAREQMVRKLGCRVVAEG